MGKRLIVLEEWEGFSVLRGLAPRVLILLTAAYLLLVRPNALVIIHVVGTCAGVRDGDQGGGVRVLVLEWEQREEAFV